MSQTEPVEDVASVQQQPETQDLQNFASATNTDEDSHDEDEYFDAESGDGAVRPRPPTCRRLFDSESRDNEETPERQNSANLIIDELRQQTAEAKEKWNFDFEKDTPLEGIWEWVPIHGPQS